MWGREVLVLDPGMRLDAFYRMLRTRRYAVAAPDAAAPQWQRLDSLLKEDAEKSWTAAYEAEEILVWLVADADLRATFDALCTEAVDTLGKDLVEKRRKAFDDASNSPPAATPGQPAGPGRPTPTAQRIALQALAEDLHEHWATEDERLEYYLVITRGTANLLIAFVGALVAALLLVLWNPFGSQDMPDANREPSLLNVLLLLLVLASGLVGSGLSMMIGLNERLEAASMGGLEKMALWTNRLGRSTIGATAALVLFALCLSGLLEGSTMPELRRNGELVALNEATLAHLVVLCILAGFSEKLVPNKLGELE